MDCSLVTVRHVVGGYAASAAKLSLHSLLRSLTCVLVSLRGRIDIARPRRLVFRVLAVFYFILILFLSSFNVFFFYLDYFDYTEIKSVESTKFLFGTNTFFG